MPASRNAQSDGHAFALYGGRTWGTGAAGIDNDADCEVADGNSGFARGKGTSRPTAKAQAASDNATMISNCSSSMFRIEANLLPSAAFAPCQRTKHSEGFIRRHHRVPAIMTRAKFCACRKSG